MSVKLYIIKQFVEVTSFNSNNCGSLSITPCPTGGDKLTDEVDLLKLAKIDTVISLLDSNDQNDLGLEDEGLCCLEQGIEFMQLPIKDFGLPDYSEAIKLGKKVLSIIQQGKHIAVHCRAGIGRSGMISATILVLFGMAPKDALDLLEEKRTRKVPDTEEQRQWILDLPKYITQ